MFEDEIPRSEYPDEFNNDPILAPNTDYLRELTTLPEHFPERLKTTFWAYHGKNIMLGCLKRTDIRNIRNQTSLIIAINHISKPDYEYTTEEFTDSTNLKHWVSHNCLRGVDGFERVMETNQTRMNINRNRPDPSLVSPRRRGFLGRLTGNR
jgi:hypothetical protein